jgi:N-succinyldiaminopimelate aminotransferase
MTEAMERADEAVAECIRPFGTTIFTEMSQLAEHHAAVNLSQGFPDFDGPDAIKRAAAEALLAGPNQYAPSPGLPRLRRAVADAMRRHYGVAVDPDGEVTVTAGATEGLSATLLGLLNPGDEVVLLEPAYDLYPAVVARAGARAVPVALADRSWELDRDALAAAFGPRTRAIIINNPQNPCGKVFTRQELEWIGELCRRHDALAVGDEVYEHLVYGDRRHISLLQVEALAARAVVISSCAKTFSMTGWKVGWAVARPRLTRGVRAAHQFLTFATPGPLQQAMAAAIERSDGYLDELLADYSAKRELLCSALERVGFDVLWPAGTYYANVDLAGLDFADDVDFCRRLPAEAGVAAIPNSNFYTGRRGGRRSVRFCFCKREATLREAVRRLEVYTR